MLISSIGGATAQAQDLLPDDNGLWHYHQPPRWRETEDHPLRILAYMVHPIGWVMREAVFRPLDYLIASTPTSRSVFGYREPFDFRNPMCFNNNGIPDCNKVAPMNALGEPSSTETTGPEVATEEKVVFPDIAFDFDKSTLNPLGQARVRQVSQMLAAMPTVKVVVEGHTDYIGSDAYNMKLGMRRAESVVKELSELGVDKARMSPISYGESRPLFTEQTDWARAANRRVQFTVQGAEVATTAAATTTASSELPKPAH
jgi:outer membrane protein OmpA-like peptidoglycan-associated protein